MSSSNIQDIVSEAAKMRSSWKNRFHNEPVFDHARATLNTAKQHAPEDTESPPSVIQRNREAFQKLKASLATIRSKNENSFFNETIPCTRGESTIRILAASDCVDQSTPVQNPPTSITGNIRPHNQESFKQARDIFLKGTEGSIKHEPEGENEVKMGVKIRVRLTENHDEEALGKVLALIDKMAPPPVKPRLCIKQDDQDKRNLVITLVEHAARAAKKKDPIKQIIGVIGKASTKATGGSNVANETSSVDVLRLATLRIDIPHSLGKWLTDPEESKKSWVTLLEGLRIGVEAIVRDATSAYAYPDIAENVLGTRTKKLSRGLATLAVMQMSKETSLEVRIPPLELLYALGVDTAAVPQRLAFFGACGGSADDLRKTGTKDYEMFKDFVESTALEEIVACEMASKLRMGASGERVKQAARFGMMFGSQDKKKQIGPLVDMLLPLKDILQEVSSISFLAESGSAELDVKGINNEIWGWLPKTVDEIIENGKAVGLASSPPLKFSEDGTKIIAAKDFEARGGDGGSESIGSFKEGQELTDEEAAKLEINRSIGPRSPELLFIAAMQNDEEEMESIVKSVFFRKAGLKPSDGVFKSNPVPSFEKAVKKIAPTAEDIAAAGGNVSSPAAASAWDLPLPAYLTNVSDGLDAGHLAQDLKLLKGGRRGFMTLMMKFAQEDQQRQEAERKQKALDNINNKSTTGGKFNRRSDGRRENHEEEESKLFSSDAERAEIRRMFDSFDEDGSGALDRTEAMAALLSFYPNISAANLLRKIREADTDGNGQLDFIEFAVIALDAKKNSR